MTLPGDCAFHVSQISMSVQLTMEGALRYAMISPSEITAAASLVINLMLTIRPAMVIKPMCVCICTCCMHECCVRVCCA